MSPRPEDVERLVRAYPRIYFACHTRHVRDPAGGGELSAHQASILDHLDPIEPTRVTDLADHMGVTPSTMSLSVKRLERGGWIRRTADPEDGRVVQLRLSEAGERIREARSVLDRKRVAELLDAMDASGREAGLRGLELLAAAAERASRRRRDGPSSSEEVA